MTVNLSSSARAYIIQRLRTFRESLNTCVVVAANTPHVTANESAALANLEKTMAHLSAAFDLGDAGAVLHIAVMLHSLNTGLENGK